MAPFTSLLLAAAPHPDGSPRVRVGAGDVLQVDVWQEPAISGRFTVGATGAIDHPLLGSVPVAGKTPEEISQHLRAKLMDGFVLDPRLTVVVAEHKSFRVSVVGGVKEPGIHFLSDRLDLFSVVMSAGGFASAPGTVTVLRARDGEVVSADLARYLRGDASQNPDLAPDDLVFVPGGAENGSTDPRSGVTVVGEVKTPGVYATGAGETVLSLVLKAGGTTDFAAKNGTRLYRDGGKAIEIRLADVLDKGQRKKDVTLQPGDLVVVPSRLF